MFPNQLDWRLILMCHIVTRACIKFGIFSEYLNMTTVDHIAIWHLAYWTKMSQNRNYGGSLQNGHLRRKDTPCSTVVTENNEKKNRFAIDRISFAKENEEFLNPLTKYFRESLRSRKEIRNTY